MKTSILSTLVMFSLSAAFGPVRLAAQSSIHFTIPFDFTVGSKPFTAGEYDVRRVTPDALAIQSTRGRTGMIVITQTSAPSSTSGVAKMTFHRYGDNYFLCGVSDNDRGWALLPSAAERELIAKRSGPAPLSIVASSAK